MSDEPQAAICHNWLDQPDGEGCWWYYCPATDEVDFVPVWPVFVGTGLGCSHGPVKDMPGKWCRAIVPQPPEAT